MCLRKKKDKKEKKAKKKKADKKGKKKKVTRARSMNVVRLSDFRLATSIALRDRPAVRDASLHSMFPLQIHSEH